MTKLEALGPFALVSAKGRKACSVGTFGLAKMVCFVFLLYMAAATAAPAQTFTNLFSFDGSNGAIPLWAGLVQGLDGNFYGTTSAGGGNGAGTAFKITRGGALTTLHSFTGGEDGSGPMPGLVLATNGDFYGVNSNGGADGGGAAFKITPGGTVTPLLGFSGGAEGANPNSALVQATNGNFYGTTVNGAISGCNDGCGAIFEMTPAGALTTLHDFDFTDGWDAQNALMVQGTDGDLYGETAGGGIAKSICPPLGLGSGCGVIFKITPGGEFTSLHIFDGTDGYDPYGGLVQATDGNLYGTTLLGGANDDGTVFKITPGGTFTKLHNFNGTDGKWPQGVVQATDGNFYGTTYYGGSKNDGTIFKITPDGTLTTLHNFDGTDGANPNSALLQATDGTFYGTTSDAYGTFSGDCPTLGCGTVFSLAMGLGPFVSFLPAARPVGHAVEILGQGFTGATAVSFNGTAASFTVESDTYLTATVPAGATTGSITVSEPGGTLTSNKIFYVTPQIFSFTPTTGAAGTTVVIIGDGFLGATRVAFACGNQATFTVDSDTQITATVPASALTGAINVVTPSGPVGSTTVFTVTP
jgi:uncharacterized repeat protein (TIGR03803 family)